VRTTAINADTGPDASGSYSQAMLVEGVQRLLFVSGQIPETRNGQVPAEFESQCRVAWANVRAQLNSAQMTISNLIKVTIFLSSREYAETNSRIRQEVLGDHKPTLTVIITDIYDKKWLLEVEAIAVA
jgi:2-iminobutanoate/2-iminopropanoate deaminase